MAVPSGISVSEDTHSSSTINVVGTCTQANGTITSGSIQWYLLATESPYAHNSGALSTGGAFGIVNTPASGDYAITGLLPNTKYRIRATFTNGSGQGFGSSIDVTTNYASPACTTDTVVLGVGSITTYGTITDLGGGTCTDKTFQHSPNADMSGFTSVNSGSGGSVGQQFSSLTNLSPGTVVYVRFTVSNELGGVPSGGAILGPFTIPADLPPTVTTQAVSAIGLDLAVGNGNVTDAGNLTITERGAVWSTATNPTTADSKSSVSGTTGAFTAPLTGLTANTLYHVRAYAINADGTSYGADVTFTTLNSTIRQTVSNDLSSGSGTTSWPAATLAGSLIVVYVDNISSDHTTTVTDSAGNTYTKGDTTGGIFPSELWYTANAAAATTITVNGTPDNTFARTFIAREYTGIRATSPLDKTAHATGTSTAISSGATASTTADKELIVGAVTWNAIGGGDSLTAGSGYSALATQTTSSNAIIGMEDATVTAQGAQTATFTGGGTGSYISACFVATFIYLDVKVVFPDVAGGSGSAFDAHAVITPNAGAATGTGTAYGVTEAIVIGGTTTATGTGQALNPSARISIAAGNAAGAGIAFNANTRIISGTATTATGIGAAFGATTSPAAPAGAAAGTGTAANAVPQVVTSASVAAGIGTAFGAFAILPDTVFAIATTAAGIGAALEPAVQIIVYAIGAEGTGLAYDLPVHFPPFVGNVATTTNPLRRRMTVTVTRPRTATVHT